MVNDMGVFDERIDNLSINYRIYEIIKAEFTRISYQNFKYCKIEFGSGKYGDFVSIELKKTGYLYINLCLSDSTIDLIIGKSKSYGYMMDDISDENKLHTFKTFIHRILNHHVEEVIYTNDHITFRDLDDNEIILTFKNMFSFVQRNKVKEKYSYQPW